MSNRIKMPLGENLYAGGVCATKEMTRRWTRQGCIISLAVPR